MKKPATCSLCHAAGTALHYSNRLGAWCCRRCHCLRDTPSRPTLATVARIIQPFIAALRVML